jgi:hypothetical protein
MTSASRRDKLYAMTRDELISRIAARAGELRAEGVEHLAIFGSRTRGDAGDDSDLDVLVDVRSDVRFSLLNLSGVALLLEEATGIPTQVVLHRSAPEAFKRRVADDLAPVF